MSITTSYVSSTLPVGFADAAEVVEGLAGQTVTAGGHSLEIGSETGEGFAGSLVFSGSLRVKGRIGLRVPVEIVVAPWSAHRSEVGIRPLGRIGRYDSARARLFYDAAWQLSDEMERMITASAPSQVGLLPVAA